MSDLAANLLSVPRNDSDRRTRLIQALRISSASYLTTALVHEMSQPLTAINAWATACLRLMKEDEIPREKLAERLGSLVQAAERATEVIRNFRRILNRRDPEFCEIDINRVLEEVAALLRKDAEECGVSMRLRLAPDLPFVRTDLHLLEIAVFVICQNSLDALKFRDRAFPDILVESRASDARTVEVTIADNGPGLDEQAMDHLFQPFASRKPDGLGVGLAMCHEIFEALGGRIWLKSNSGDGACFAFALPGVAKGEASEPDARTG